MLNWGIILLQTINMEKVILSCLLYLLLQTVGAGVVTVRRINACRDCRMSEGTLTCGMEASQPVSLFIPCEVESLVTTDRLMVVGVEGRAATIALARTTIECREIEADVAIINGQLCPQVTTTTKVLIMY